MYYISESMVRWLAPVLSFTAEEIWSELPGERTASVFLAEFADVSAAANSEIDWSVLIRVRETVAKALEDLRTAGGIGSALEASVTLYADGDLRSTLEALGEELRFVFITSAAEVQPLADAPDNAATGEGFSVLVAACDHAKCIRCWHRREDVGSNAEHPEICGRCVSNIEGPGELRRYA
jgi:isoleucyl-tRNA synthetase